MAVSTDQLKQIPLFADLDDRELKTVAASLHERTFNAGESPTTEGKSGVGMFVIESGEATVKIGDREVRRLGPGDYFGEIALITGSPRSATITAETELTCHGLTAWEFKPLVEANGSLGWKLLRTLAQRLADAEN